ncbi:two-component system sensor histidine kinase/response regulator hybrid [Pedobacter sp. BAL39]|uniref:ligand-binding sensor domain-containing protein n=1 Tax=Pedobacter sp. BAL39 TaxID=391596 RepID=UPI000155A4BA|nr:two-component regulator propeller domain-containing protein [Pedobacter sp. BAL39]EDM34333.1 two-component system sensor histidine kinase/response regulator hybrid [Pedobacter sp. BAL39]
MKKLTLFLFLIFSAALLSAQPYYFKHYQVENGLSNNTVFCSTQDNNGFMWFGTKDGLNRFDGYSFKTYRHDPAQVNSLGNDLIQSLHSDKNEGLWVGTANGLYHYDPTQEEFHLIKETKDMAISELEVDPKGDVWLIALYKVYKYDVQRKSMRLMASDAPFAASFLFCRENGEMLSCSANGTIHRFNAQDQRFENCNFVDKKQSSALGWIASIQETADGQFLIGTVDAGIKLLNPVKRQLTNLVTMNKDKTHIFVRDMMKLNDHEFWIATESGIYIYNHQTAAISNLRKVYSNSYALSDNAVYSICRDREGGMWVGTYFGGINYYARRNAIFNKYFPIPEQNSITGSDVRELSKDTHGNLWVGTEDAGLNKLHLSSGQFTSFKPDGTGNSISYSNIHGLLADGDRLWVGTFEHGLDVLDIRTGRAIKHYLAGKGSGLRSNFIFTFHKTRAGVILIATTAGIYTYDAAKDHFDLIPGLPVMFFNNLLEDSEGNIWAGTFNEGIYRFRLGKPGYENFRRKAGNKKSLSSNTINGIFEDSRKQIWVTTDGSGFCRYLPQRSEFEHYTVEDGLPSNFLFKILEDEQHRFWISSTRGLVRFNPETKKVKVYTRSDGLITDQFNYNSAFKDEHGRMYFGSVKGLISFQPQQINDDAYTAPVFMTGFHIENEEKEDGQGKSFLHRSPIYADTIVLKHNQSSFSIDFAALSYFSSDMTEYAYKMTGLYKDWEYLKTNRKVYFTKLAPGNYVFEARALVNGSTVWSKKNVRIYIKVLPPFWKSLPAYLMYVFLCLAAVSFLVHRYHKRQERKNRRRMEVFEHEKEKEIYQAKIEFFTNVAHEIRTPLTLIKGPMEKLIKQ